MEYCKCPVCGDIEDEKFTMEYIETEGEYLCYRCRNRFTFATHKGKYIFRLITGRNKHKNNLRSIKC